MLILVGFGLGFSVLSFSLIHVFWINNGYRWFKAVKEIQSQIEKQEE